MCCTVPAPSSRSVVCYISRLYRLPSSIKKHAVGCAGQQHGSMAMRNESLRHAVEDPLARTIRTTPPGNERDETTGRKASSCRATPSCRWMNLVAKYPNQRHRMRRVMSPPMGLDGVTNHPVRHRHPIG